MPSKSSSFVDARHALKLCEVSRVLLRLRIEEFLVQRCAQLVAVSNKSDATPEAAVQTLASLVQGRRVLRRGRRPCENPPERLFAFYTKGFSNICSLALHVSLIKRHGPIWLLHTQRSCIPSRSFADV